MSGLAVLLAENGFLVSGSDRAAPEPAMAQMFEKYNINVLIGHSAENIDKNTQLAVFTLAVPPDNPELLRARELNIQTVSRAQLLGRVTENYKTSAGVAGCHGKTTTTAMLAQITLPQNPTVLLGGEHAMLDGGNIHIGSRDLIIFEACEYRDSFLKCKPDYAVILNIDADHLDYFTDMAHIRRSFKTYAESARRGVIINAQITNYADIIKDVKTPVATFCQNGAACDFSAQNITTDDCGKPSFDIYENKILSARVNLNVIGRVNAQNALSAFAAAAVIKKDAGRREAAAALSAFTPVNRRLQYKGEHNGAAIFDDYAHHPTEIKNALEALAQIGKNRVFVLFQPHTYSRTKALFGEFAASFENAYHVGLTEIYAAREPDLGQISSEDLAQAIRERGKAAASFASFADAAAYYKKCLQPGDLFLTMGAGDVFNVCDMLTAL